MNATSAPTETRGAKEETHTDRPFAELTGPLESVRRPPPSFPELAGAGLATLVLSVICGLAVAFLVTWWRTRPSIADVQALFGSAGSAKEVLEALQALRSPHFGELREFFQVVVLSGLAPLFTLQGAPGLATGRADRMGGSGRAYLAYRSPPGIAALRENLGGFHLSIKVRIGLTLQALQSDLARLRPELVLLYCHGTREGSLL